MTDQITICNMALALINTRSTISNLNEGSKESNAISLFYAPVLDDTLRSANWNFTKRQVTLSQIGSAATNDCPIPWNYKYAYPSDCLKIRYLIPSFTLPLQASIPTQLWMGPPILFEEASDIDTNGNDIKVILTNQAQAVMWYTKRITDTTVWDPNFVMAFSGKLAVAIAPQLTGSEKLINRAIQQANAAIMLARSTDGNEGITIQEHTPDWMRVRGYASDVAWPWGGYPNYVNFEG